MKNGMRVSYYSRLQNLGMVLSPLVFCLSFMFPFLAQATPPSSATPGPGPSISIGGMYGAERVLNEVQSTVTSQTQTACHSAESTAVAPSSFQATTECQVRCRSTGRLGSKQTITSSFRFSPEKLGLRRGDGNIPYQHLTATLTQQAQLNCVAAGSAHCGTLQNISDVELTRLNSGTWSISNWEPCSRREHEVPSPYDQNYRLQTASNPNDPTPHSPLPDLQSFGGVISPLPRSPEEFITEERENGTTEAATTAMRSLADGKINVEQCTRATGEDYSYPCESISALMSQKRNYQDRASCNTILTLNTCFGDCLSSNGYRYVLTSNQPNARNTISVCADSFIQEIQQRKLGALSASVLQTFCEDFAWRSLFRMPAFTPASQGLSCAAYRGTVDCQQTLRQIGRRRP